MVKSLRNYLKEDYVISMVKHRGRLEFFSEFDLKPLDILLS
jgi:hypothetical protein